MALLVRSPRSAIGRSRTCRDGALTTVDRVLRELGAHGSGGINPDEHAAAGAAAVATPGPLQFVNLLAYRAEAAYPEGHELAGAGLTGAEAYGRYGAVALGHVMRRGGTLTLYNDVLPGPDRPERTVGPDRDHAVPRDRDASST